MAIRKIIRRWKIRRYINKIAEDHRPILERLNDYDEYGVPYWEKTGTVDPDYESR